MELLSKIKDLFRSPWNPSPISAPTVDPHLADLDPLTRSAESLRHSVLSLEFWISPNGQVREWLRHNTRLAVVLAIPAFLILPIISFALWQLVSWLAALFLIAGNLVVIPILALVATFVLVIVCLLFRVIFK